MLISNVFGCESEDHSYLQKKVGGLSEKNEHLEERKQMSEIVLLNFR